MKTTFLVGAFLSLISLTVSAAEPSLEDFVGQWSYKGKDPACSALTIEKAGTNQVQITRTGQKFIVSRPGQVQTNDFDMGDEKLRSTTVAKFIRGKIVSAHIWDEQKDMFLGVGLRVFQLNGKGRLTKSKAGLTFQEPDPKEKPGSNRNQIYKVGGKDAVVLWQVECEYSKN